MQERPQYIQLKEAIKIIENAAKQNLITTRARELIITELHFLMNPDKYHRP